MRAFTTEALDPVEARATIEDVLDANEALGDGGGSAAIMIWGAPGIGKTELVGQVAEARGCRFAKLSPAEATDFGDLLGAPRVRPGGSDKEEEVTRFARPEELPSEKGPGLLLLDDFNRAEPHIINALMFLVQNRRTSLGWRLPAGGWTIVATGNPEAEGHFMVGAMDDAIRERFVHINLRFSHKAWALWAARAGISRRDRDFVLLYPELFGEDGETSPRTMTRFFRLVESATARGGGELERIERIGRCCLPESTLGLYKDYVGGACAELIDPRAMLCAQDFAPFEREITALALDGNTLRADRLSILATRVFLELTDKEFDPAGARPDNLVAFLGHECMPADIRLLFWRDVAALAGRPEIKSLVADPRLAALVLA